MRATILKANVNLQTLSGLFARFPLVLALIFSVFLAGSCNQIQPPKPESFAGEIAPPRKQEFRWSNGKMPKNFDPAQASASPETDIVRALFEGLTDNDSKTLETIPALAVKWSASDDFKVWTFQLRQDARWSNGESVTAQDFVKSWKRLTELGEKVGQRDLFRNIVGMDTKNVLPVFANEELDKYSELPTAAFVGQEKSAANTDAANANLSAKEPKRSLPKQSKPKTSDSPIKEENSTKFGVEAVGDYVLKVTLNQPDKTFPALVAHPVFRPIYGDGQNLDSLNENVVTNGAFKVAEIAKSGLALERSETYWNKNAVKLERVRFVPTENAESAIAAYRAGEIDAITNANLQPLALKLLTPYEDFRKTKHSAINFYEFNAKQYPFNDRRVREALAISIERERLTQGDMDGTTEPAFSFSPFENDEKLSQNFDRARQLLAEAGFSSGEDFPVIRLVINRNNVQQKIARSIAAMWKKNLKIETEIIIKDQKDFEDAAQFGDYDIIRRGVVLPTTDETANMLNMFPVNRNSARNFPKTELSAKNQILNDKTAESALDFSALEEVSRNEQPIASNINSENHLILTDEEALAHLPAIPLYFPLSYSLVKPYVQGFEMNQLDAISLKDVEIDSNWQPSEAQKLSK